MEQPRSNQPDERVAAIMTARSPRIRPTVDVVDDDLNDLTCCACLSCVFCCCLFGLLAVHFSSQAQVARRQQDYVLAANYQRKAKIFIALAAVVGVAMMGMRQYL